MAQDEPRTTVNQRSRIKELVVEGTIEALNAGIEQMVSLSTTLF